MSTFKARIDQIRKGDTIVLTDVDPEQKREVTEVIPVPGGVQLTTEPIPEPTTIWGYPITIEIAGRRLPLPVHRRGSPDRGECEVCVDLEAVLDLQRRSIVEGWGYR